MHPCPVCAYVGLEEPAYDNHGYASFEICACCGIEFGYQDARRSHGELRREWIANGMKWHHPPPPAGWNPVAQLRNAGFDLPGAAMPPGDER